MGNASIYFNTHPYSVRYIDDIKKKKKKELRYGLLIVSDSKILVQYQTKPFFWQTKTADWGRKKKHY